MKTDLLSRAIRTLDQTAPPAFRTPGECAAEIARLEELLGIPHRPPIFNVLKANMKIATLRDMLASKPAAEKAPATLPPVPTPAPEEPESPLDKPAEPESLLAQLERLELSGDFLAAARFRQENFAALIREQNAGIARGTVKSLPTAARLERMKE